MEIQVEQKMGNEMETMYWGYIGMMENQMETTRMGLQGTDGLHQAGRGLAAA